MKKDGPPWRLNVERQIVKIQESCLEILRDIDRVCRQFHIQYSLCGGSVIGYHLYQGFIPWDDDIDLMMTRDQYDRFLKLYPEHGSPRYRLLHYDRLGSPDVPTLFSRVEDMEEDITETIAGSTRQGHVFIDITVFDMVPSGIHQKWIRLHTSYAYTMLYRRNGMVPGTLWKRALYKCIPSDRKESSILDLYRRTEELCRKSSQRHPGGPYCAELLSAAYGGILYKASVFDKYRNVVFSGVRTRINADYRNYLYMRYGKREFTRDIPESEKRQHINSEG
jgi:lipopolysaccharide cholinephosphotransferase